MMNRSRNWQVSEAAFSHRYLRAIALVCILGLLFIVALPALAQSPRRVQIINGHVDPGGQAVYRLSGLQQNQRLYVYVETVQGNLDPFVFILRSGEDLGDLIERYTHEMENAANDTDPSTAINAVRDRFTLAWDDDSGKGYAAALEFRVPEDDDYLLVVGGSFSTLGRQTSGYYRLSVGLDAPQVLLGEAEPQGQPFARLETDVIRPDARVEELTGEISAQKTRQSYNLIDFNPGDTFYAYVEATSGDLAPALILRDFGGKPLSAANLRGSSRNSSLTFKIDERLKNASLEVFDGHGNNAAASGHYLLWLGLNAPEILTGQAQPSELPVVRQPIEVQIGIKLQQIANIDQKNGFFNAVGSLQMEWTDPALAFSPDSCQCSEIIYTEKEFDRFLADVNGRWPDFTFFNQQGNRWIQNKVAVRKPNGRVIYFERFTTDLQADLDFRQYPFDVQQFLIQIDLLHPHNRYFFVDLPGFSEVSEDHGEEELIIQDFKTDITSVQSSTQQTNSRFTFSFEGPRHLIYYVFRIFIPVLLITLISWWTFLLYDYNKRIEVTAGNILLFIAFSFSLAENYPRLGYLTFLDALMAMVFIINALLLVYNVYLKRLEIDHQAGRIIQIDKALGWIYPLIYLLALVVLYVIFF